MNSASKEVHGESGSEVVAATSCSAWKRGQANNKGAKNLEFQNTFFRPQSSLNVDVAVFVVVSVFSSLK